jgi:hypothetical protein
MDRNPKFKWGRLALAASFLTVAFGVAIAVWSQSPNFEITLAGQSMIRSDFQRTCDYISVAEGRRDLYKFRSDGDRK